MTKEEALDRVNNVMRDAFNREDLTVGFDTTAKDVEGWDSLRHIMLIEMIEDEFDMRFEMKEVTTMANVGEMIDIILTRVK